jgi:translation initiation factor 3 subunit C
VKAQAAMQKEKVEAIELVLTEEELSNRMKDIVASRGRKGTDPRDLLRKLEVLSRAARRFGPRVEIPVLMHLISAMYDAHRVIDDFMVLHQWRTCFRSLMRVVNLLSEDHKLELTALVEEGYSVGIAGGPEEEVKEENKNMISVVGSLETFLMRLEDEYTKSLQQINPHTQVSKSFYIL